MFLLQGLGSLQEKLVADLGSPPLNWAMAGQTQMGRVMPLPEAVMVAGGVPDSTHCSSVVTMSCWASPRVPSAPWPK